MKWIRRDLSTGPMYESNLPLVIQKHGDHWAVCEKRTATDSDGYPVIRPGQLVRGSFKTASDAKAWIVAQHGQQAPSLREAVDMLFVAIRHLNPDYEFETTLTPETLEQMITDEVLGVRT